MQTVTFTKKFLSGTLAGLHVTQTLQTDHPENFWVGRKYSDIITNNMVEIVFVECRQDDLL